MLFGAAVGQGGALFAKASTNKGWAGAAAQQPLQDGAVVCFDTHTGIDRKPAVRVGQHVFGVTTLQQAPGDEGAQDASAQICLYLGHSGLIDSTGRVKDDDRRKGLGIGVARHFLKHPIDHTDLTTKLRRRLTIARRACYAAAKCT